MNYTNDEFKKEFGCRSIYFAAYLMCKYNKKLVGTGFENKKVVFLFDQKPGEIKRAMDEFTGKSDNGMLHISDYMSFVNQLKDVARSMTKKGD